MRPSTCGCLSPMAKPCKRPGCGGAKITPFGWPAAQGDKIQESPKSGKFSFEVSVGSSLEVFTTLYPAPGALVLRMRGKLLGREFNHYQSFLLYNKDLR